MTLLQTSAATQSAPARAPTITPPIKSLRLDFAPPADAEALREFLLSDKKKEFDPQARVRPRSIKTITNAIEKGNLAYVSDNKGEYKALCMAYNQHHDPSKNMPSFSEVGSVLNLAQGLGLAKYIVTALALKKTILENGQGPVIAKVAPDNAGAQKLFDLKLHWHKVSDFVQIGDYYNSSASTTINKDTHVHLRNWFEFLNEAQTAGRSLLQDTLANPLLIGRDGKRYELEVSDNIQRTLDL